MQLTMLKILAIANMGWGIPFPWWMWLWGIVSEFNGIIKESLFLSSLVIFNKSKEIEDAPQR